MVHRAPRTGPPRSENRTRVARLAQDLSFFLSYFFFIRSFFFSFHSFFLFILFFFSFFLSASFFLLSYGRWVARAALGCLKRIYKRISNGFKTRCHKRMSGAFRRRSEMLSKAFQATCLKCV